MELEVVTKSEAARRWEISPAAVGKYVAKGMPVRADGKLDWLAVDEWRRTYNAPSKSGSFMARQAQKSDGVGIPSQAPRESGESEAHRGFTIGFAQARASIRQGVPELLATMRPAHVEDRIATFAVIDYLLGKWLGTPATMPEIDWAPFTSGTNPERAAALFTALQADFETAE